ncbi:MAG: histidinol-phosphate transaminase [Dehalococcoidia bacterium]
MDKISKKIRNHLRIIQTYEGVDSNINMSEKSGIPEKNIIRLNANENPYGTIQEVRDAIKNISFHEYPDPEQKKIRKAISQYVNIPDNLIIAGAGGDEIIDLILRLFINEEDEVIDCIPTFGMYNFAAKLSNSSIISIERKKDWDLNIEKIISKITKKTKVIFIASPNNPTGNLAKEHEIISLLETGIIVCLDETYYEFSNFSMSHLLSKYDNLIIIRSFSKWAGIAGLRVGYAISSEIIIKHLMDIKQPYNVNVAAETAVIETLNYKEKLLDNVTKLMDEKIRLEKYIKSCNRFISFPSSANFLLCKFHELTSQEIYDIFSKKGIFIRKFDNKILENCIRISSGTYEQTDKVIDILTEINNK